MPKSVIYLQYNWPWFFHKLTRRKRIVTIRKWRHRSHIEMVGYSMDHFSRHCILCHFSSIWIASVWLRKRSNVSSMASHLVSRIGHRLFVFSACIYCCTSIWIDLFCRLLGAVLWIFSHAIVLRLWVVLFSNDSKLFDWRHCSFCQFNISRQNWSNSACTVAPRHTLVFQCIPPNTSSFTGRMRRTLSWCSVSV